MVTKAEIKYKTMTDSTEVERQSKF